MQARPFALAFALSLAAAGAASGEEVTVALTRRVRVPVGPPATSAQVRRFRVQGRSFVAVTAPAASTTSRCNVPLQRATVWEQTRDRGWLEVLTDTFDVCTRHPGVLRTVTVGVVDGPEVHVLLAEPRMPSAAGTLARYHLLGDRFVGPHRTRALAAAPAELAQGTLPVAPAAGALDGELGEWTALPPFLRQSTPAGRATVWLGLEGRVLRFAAQLEPREPLAAGEGSLALVLSEHGISTNLLHSTADNHGRFLTARCDGASTGDAEVRCTRDGTTLAIEGRTDLGTMVWAAPVIATLDVLAQVSLHGRAGIASDASQRLHPFALARPVDLLEQASPSARAQCRHGFRTFVPTGSSHGGEGILSCGARCQNDACDRIVVLSGAERLAWTRGDGGLCVGVQGAGHEDFAACGPAHDHVRLLTSIPLRGFTTVIAVERTLRRGEDSTRRAEVWAIVTRSSAWRRLWQGAETPAGDEAPPTVTARGAHPVVCRAGDAAACEVIDAVTFAPPPPATVTAGLLRASRTAGLDAPLRF